MLFKKKAKTPNYEGLHGRELIDAINRDTTFGTPYTEQDYAWHARRMENDDRKMERRMGIESVLRRIFFTPLGILFRAITFIFRVIGGIASIGILLGIWYAYKAFQAWKSGMAFFENGDIKTAAALIVFPFIAYAVSVLAEKAWEYFEDNAC